MPRKKNKKQEPGTFIEPHVTMNQPIMSGFPMNQLIRGGKSIWN